MATRVTVVAHDIEPNIIAGNLGHWADDSRVRLLHLVDGIASPSGPMNLGLAASEAPFTALLGSDDTLEPGALDSWVKLQKDSGASMVMAMVRHIGGGKEHSPSARPWKVRDLDPVKDRLSYRSAPLGLISREVHGNLRFPEGLASGEDLPYVARLWFSGGPIAFARSGPGYLVGHDAIDRVTSAPRPIVDDFAFLDHIIGAPEFAHLSKRQRTALGIKLLRLNILDAVVNRAQVEWAPGERAALAAVAERIILWAGHPERLLSLLDRSVIDGVLDGVTSIEDMMDSIRKRWNYRSADVVLPRNPALALHRQAPLRTYVGGYFV